MHELSDVANGAALDQPPRLSRAWYGVPIEEFLTTSQEQIVGTLASNSRFPITIDQRDAWLTEITALKSSIPEIAGHIFLEFEIPRMGHRVDAVIVSGPVIFVVEFKAGATSFDRSAIDQVWDYALDLLSFVK